MDMGDEKTYSPYLFMEEHTGKDIVTRHTKKYKK